MRKVFSNIREVIHLFAQQTQSEASCGNVYFRKQYCSPTNYGDIIYSYGSHYVLGLFLPTKQGEILVINDRGYSNTTAKHISYLMQATRQYNCYNLSEYSINDVYYSIVSNYDKLKKAKKALMYIKAICSLYERYMSFKEKFGMYLIHSNNTNIGLSKKLNDTEKKQLKAIQKIYKLVNNAENLEKAREQAKKQAEIKKAREIEQQKQDLKKFFNYEIHSIRGDEDFLRISQNGEFLQTSQGVKIEINEARAMYRAILSGVDIKGYKISNYTVTSLNGVLTVGCHKINVTNMHEIGRKICKI